MIQTRATPQSHTSPWREPRTSKRLPAALPRGARGLREPVWCFASQRMKITSVLEIVAHKQAWRARQLLNLRFYFHSRIWVSSWGRWGFFLCCEGASSYIWFLKERWLPCATYSVFLSANHLAWRGGKKKTQKELPAGNAKKYLEGLTLHRVCLSSTDSLINLFLELC